MAEQNILEKILIDKAKEIESLPAFDAQQVSGLAPCKGFIAALQNTKPALIAEVKKASPSKGVIKEDFDHMAIAKAYKNAGAACLSVLTDEKYFQGKLSYLSEISQSLGIPCLRKDFVIDKRQILEARLAGADAILLIAAALDDSQLIELYNCAIDLGLDVLLEVHDAEEMRRALKTPAKLIGINNRNLKTFEVSLDTSINLIAEFTEELKDRIIVSESGIYSSEDIQILASKGVGAFLVGESLIKQDDIEKAVKELLK